MSGEWRSELERSGELELIAMGDFAYTATAADRGVEEPPISPYGLIALDETWKLLDDNYIMTRNYAMGYAVLSVRIGVMTSDPVTAGGRLNIGGAYELAERTRKRLQGRTLQFNQANEVDGVGAVFPLSYLQELPSYTSEGGLVEIEQLYRLQFELMSAAQ